MTTDLLLIPERMDFDNPFHVFGFDTNRIKERSVLDLILLGLELYQANEPEEFATKGVRLKVEHQDIEPSSESQLGRNFLQ